MQVFMVGMKGLGVGILSDRNNTVVLLATVPASPTLQLCTGAPMPRGIGARVFLGEESVSQKQIDLVQWESGEWVALYVDGKLVYEGHSINGVQMLEMLDIYHHRWDVPADEETEVDFCGIKDLSALTRMLTEGY